MNLKTNRRYFLRYLAAGVSAVALQSLLSACGQETAQPTPVDQTESLPTITTYPTSASSVTEAVPEAPTSTSVSPKPTSTVAASATTPSQGVSSQSHLVVVRQGEPEALVRTAITALGGMQQFVKKGSKVVVKPNICNAYNSYEYASTTNPWVVGALVKLCFEVGASQVLVLDYPFGGESKDAYIRSGIQEQVLAAGGQMQAIATMKFQKTQLPEGKDLKSAAIYDEILKADTLINVPIAKDHGLSRLTLGMKNLMGVIQSREVIHFNFGQRLADLTSKLRPALTVIDAVRILTANGPTGGNLDDVKKLDTIIASADIIAADSYATSLFNLKPQDIASIPAGAAMGLGESDLSKVKVEELTVAG